VYVAAEDVSRATRFLARRPALRGQVLSAPLYQAWKARLPPVVIDGIPFYFPEGDIQKEEDDLILDFAIREGLVTPREVDATLAGEPEASR